jgi:hypothetical protein
MTVGEMRGLEFADTLKEDVGETFDDVGVGTDYLIQADGDVAEVGGVLFGITAHEDGTWNDVAEVRDYLQRRLNDIGVAWEMNDRLEQREWKESLDQSLSPYAEIVTAELTENHLARFNR